MRQCDSGVGSRETRVERDRQLEQPTRLRAGFESVAPVEFQPAQENIVGPGIDLRRS